MVRASGAAPGASGARAATRPSRCRSRSRFARPGPGLRGRAEEHVLPGARGRHAFLSHHIGDLENYETLRSFAEGIEHFRRLFDVEPRGRRPRPAPRLPVHGTRPRLRAARGELVAVQHHHAHIASCLADNGEAGPGDRRRVRRHRLRHRRHASGAASSSSPTSRASSGPPTWRRCRCQAARRPSASPGGWRPPTWPPPTRTAPARPACAVRGADEERWRTVAGDGARAESTRRSPPAPGACSTRWRPCSACATPISYEGQAAIELEQLVDPAEAGATGRAADGGEPLRIAGADLVRAAVGDLSAGVAAPVIAARFHNGVAARHRGRLRTLRDRSRPGHRRAVRRRVPEPAAADRVVDRAGRRAASGC